MKGGNREVKQVPKQEHFAQDESDFYFDGFVRLGKNVRGWMDSWIGRDSDDGVADSASEIDDVHLVKVGTDFAISPPHSVE